MYYIISGAPFSIKDTDEKKEFLDIINKDSIFSEHLVCRGVNAEQFTGKVNDIIVSEKSNPNKVYVFKCDGNFPTLKLYQKSSAVVYAIEFPVKETPVIEDPTVIPKEPVSNPAAEEKTPLEVVSEVTEVVANLAAELPVVEEPKSEPAAEFQPLQDAFSSDPFEREEPVILDDVQDETPTSDEPVNEQPKKRGRKKKNS